MSKTTSAVCKLLSLTWIVSFSFSSSQAATVSFRVDPTTIDINPADTFITGTEFSPTGSDGTQFIMEPTNNQTGSNRFLLSVDHGLSFGGGSASSVSFDFTPLATIDLNSYAIGGGLSLNDPEFDILDGTTKLSIGNDGTASGNFNGGPLRLMAGTTYSFVVTNNLATRQRQMATWDYTFIAVPEPSCRLSLIFVSLGFVCWRRRSVLCSQS